MPSAMAANQGNPKCDDRDAAEVSAGPEQCGVPERQQAEIAVNQIEAERIEPIDQNVGGERRERHDEGKHQNHQAGDAGTMPGGELKPAHRHRLRPRIWLGNLVHALIFTFNSSIRRGRKIPAAG